MTQRMNWKYREEEILSAEPIKLVRMLFAGAVEAVAEARRELSEGDILGRSRAISRANLIVNELALALDPAAGGELGRNLADLYAYIQKRLLEANFKQADGPLAEAEQLLRTLLEGWEACEPAPAVRVQAPTETTHSYLSVTDKDYASVSYAG
jgi:flagellar protein FliS